MRTRRMAVAVAGILAVLPLIGSANEKQSVNLQGTLLEKTKQLEKFRYDGARETLLAAAEKTDSRTLAMDTLVKLNAREAPAVIASVLDDKEPKVRSKAAEWLAIYGDKRGLDRQAECVTNSSCQFPFDSARLLGNVAKPEYVLILRAAVERVRARAYVNGAWRETAEDRAMLDNSILALARIGRREDGDLIIEVVSSRPRRELERLQLEALGYVDDPRSRQILWAAYEKLLKPPKCDDAGMGVRALLPLSRLGEPLAIERLRDIVKGVGTPPDVFQGQPALCGDREQAFRGLKPRDAANFAEAVFEVARQEPEGMVTVEAWQALGIMHPKGFGERLLKLAASKRPRWKLVGRDLLNKAIIAVDPALNERFWSYFKVEFVPDMLPEKRLVEMGLGRLMFQGTYYWTGD